MMTLLLLAHFPVALAFAALHGTWLPALVVGSIASFGPLALAARRPGSLETRLAVGRRR